MMVAGCWRCAGSKAPPMALRWSISVLARRCFPVSSTDISICPGAALRTPWTASPRTRPTSGPRPWANARRALASGVTTVQDLGDSGYAVVDVRDASRGDVRLPRMRASGPPITTVGGHCHFLTGAETVPVTSRPRCGDVPSAASTSSR